MKFIKTRLRCNLANEKLEVFMLMCSEKDLLDGITVDDIISILTKTHLYLLNYLVCNLDYRVIA